MSVYKVISHNLGYILYGVVICGVLERFLTHGAGGGYCVNRLAGQVHERCVPYLGLLLNAEFGITQIESAAHALLSLETGLLQVGHGAEHLTRFIINATAAAKFTGIMV